MLSPAGLPLAWTTGRSHPLPIRAFAKPNNRGFAQFRTCRVDVDERDLRTGNPPAHIRNQGTDDAGADDPRLRSAARRRVPDALSASPYWRPAPHVAAVDFLQHHGGARREC